MDDLMIDPNFKLHACHGEQCYCRASNVSKIKWSEDEKMQLKDAVEYMNRKKQERESI